MRKFDVAKLAYLLDSISEAMEVIHPFAKGDDRDKRVPPDSVKLWGEPSLLLAQSVAPEIHLDSTNKRVWLGGGPFHVAVTCGLTWQQLYNELLVLRQAIESDLETRDFVFILPDRAKLLREMEAEWQAVWTAFPEAKSDIEEMVYCYALERHTAAVFHLMCVLEWGLRALCLNLGIKKVKNFIRKTGRTELVPITYNIWGKIIGQLRSKVNKKIAKLQKGSTKQKLQEFYFPVIQDIEDVKESWRNHVMHGRRIYNAEEATAAISHVKPIMMALVSRGIKTVG
ncbi:MAG TPA: hypothetical protein VFE02_02795 [Candidatus Acidoferrales bacterium]|nr:hypothetical protein [Candidatus Acidoferrales bacterium]